MSVTVKLDTRFLNEIIRQAPQASNEAVGRVAAQMVGWSKSFAPIDTGALKNSLDTENESEGLWIVHDGVEYGIWQEFGTRKMAAHPFMTPAAEMVWNELIDPETFKAVFE